MSKIEPIPYYECEYCGRIYTLKTLKWNDKDAICDGCKGTKFKIKKYTKIDGEWYTE